MRLGQEIQTVPRSPELTSTPRTERHVIESPKPFIHVLVGVLRRADGRVLIARRPGDKHLGGAWEFPGGKRISGEDRLSALGRELAEELGVIVRAARPLVDFEHEYADRRVRLDVWWVDAFDGVARSLEGQALRWIDVSKLDSAQLLVADQPIIDAIRTELGLSIGPA